MHLQEERSKSEKCSVKCTNMLVFISKDTVYLIFIFLRQKNKIYDIHCVTSILIR